MKPRISCLYVVKLPISHANLNSYILIYILKLIFFIGPEPLYYHGLSYIQEDIRKVLGCRILLDFNVQLKFSQVSLILPLHFWKASSSWCLWVSGTRTQYPIAFSLPHPLPTASAPLPGVTQSSWSFLLYHRHGMLESIPTTAFPGSWKVNIFLVTNPKSLDSFGYLSSCQPKIFLFSLSRTKIGL